MSNTSQHGKPFKTPARHREPLRRGGRVQSFAFGELVQAVEIVKTVQIVKAQVARSQELGDSREAQSLCFCLLASEF